MLIEHSKLLYAIQQAGQVVGRKKLQKIIYISKKCQYDFQQKYNFHFFGPYSEELSLQIEELTNLGFIQEVKETKSGYSQYNYELSDKGKEYLEVYPIEMERYQSFVHDLNEQSSRFLELVSTMLYFDKLEQEALFQKVAKVKAKQNYTDEEMDRAFVYIKQLRAVN
ncbi:YwgA family protein [Bacillus horti]|uniref:Uncharacterized protein YwgA n=1 Tax=Caldalkalibacillus horti TaxID=77523 RepID=A0ABT9VVU6_9BACI|nr:YwgA family protein [Bacillus horti]MDQ0165087.1 uncharacterized protein YwgA [Bacillus horti]